METTITSSTTLYALLGYPVSHSISPIIHNSLFALQSLDSRYITLKTPPGKLAEAVSVLKTSFAGFNVTIPYKQAIMSYLDEIDTRARLYGSVNTVKNVNGRLLGYNTDGCGFMQAFHRLGIQVMGKKAIVLGAGGAARSVIYELLERNCHITVINRSADNAVKLRREFSGRQPGVVKVGNWDRIEGTYDFLINTTPVGMVPDTEQSPVNLNTLGRLNCKVVYDLIYNPASTRFLTAARHCGCTTINGYPMLFYQALEANRIWTGLNCPEAWIEGLYKETEHYLMTFQSKAAQKIQ